MNLRPESSIDHQSLYLLAMATQQSNIKQFFKQRKRPVSLLKKDQDLSERPAKVFVTEEKLGLEDVKPLTSKIVYSSSSHSKNDAREMNKSNDSASNKKISLFTETNETSKLQTLARPKTPENFISVEAPRTPRSIRNAEPTTPSISYVLPERPKTPEPNVETLQAIQKKNLTGLNDLKKKSRLQKKLQSVKESIDRFNQHSSRLEAIQNALRETDVDLPKDREDHEPISPRKTPLKRRLIFPKEKSTYGSPTKQYVSPRKLLLDGPVDVKSSPIKQPAYKRFADLTSIQEKGTLILPYKYRMLAEVFRTVETIVSMIHTRGENITFEKLQAGYQSMSKKVLTLQHLGQIKTILPSAYSYHVEKFHKFGTQAGTSDKYELLIKPILTSKNSESSHCSMNSALLLNRRRDFHKRLMDLTKQYHEEFLLALVPPVFLDKEKLTRWHPDFDLDKVPDIEVQDIPVPKTQVVNTSAKQLLDRAKTLLSVNRKLSLALESIKEPPTTPTSECKPSTSELGSTTPTSTNTPGPKTPSTSMVESGPSTTTSSSMEPDSTAAMAEQLNKVIKGIPKGLLEKVRARQAAKALEAMTQSPGEIQEAVMLSRLPEIARILRVLYVAERRSVLPLDNVVQRIAHSFRENLSPAEIRKHLELLCKNLPGWASFQIMRSQEFFKVAKDQNLNTIVSKLQELANMKDKSV